MEYTKIKKQYTKFLLSSNRRFMLLYGFIIALFMPLCILFFGISGNNSYSLYLLGKVFALVCATIATIVIPLSIYKFSTSKKALDVYDSLPIRKETLFRIHYLVGLFELLVPFIINWLVALALTCYLSPTNFRGSIYLSSSLPTTTIQIELIILLELCIVLIASYTFTCFIRQNCGTIVDSFINTCIWLLLPALTYIAFYYYCSNNLLGFSIPFESDIMMYLSPIICGFANLYIDSLSIYQSGIFIFYVVFSIIFYYISSHLYVNHKAENAEKPYTSKHFFPITSIICAVVVMLLIHTMISNVLNLTSFLKNYLYPLLIGGALYLIMDVIAHRGFKNIVKAGINIVVIESIVLALLIPIQVTKGFGYVTRTPSFEAIEAVNVTYPYSYAQKFNLASDADITYTNANDIQAILRFHEYILDNYSQSDYSYYKLMYEYYYDVQKIIIEYDLNFGTLTRSYNIPIEWFNQIQSLINSSAHYEARFPHFEINNYTSSSLHVHNTLDIVNEANGINIDSFLDINKLKTMLYADISNETPLNLISSQKVVGYININLDFKNELTAHNSMYDFYNSSIKYNKYNASYSFMLPIYEAYDIVISYLESNGIIFEDLKYNKNNSVTIYRCIDNSDDVLFEENGNVYTQDKFTMNYEEIAVIDGNDDSYQAIAPYIDIEKSSLTNKKYMLQFQNSNFYYDLYVDELLDEYFDQYLEKDSVQ